MFAYLLPRAPLNTPKKDFLDFESLRALTTFVFIVQLQVAVTFTSFEHRTCFQGIPGNNSLIRKLQYEGSFLPSDKKLIDRLADNSDLPNHPNHHELF